jgi:hypothetical protein
MDDLTYILRYSFDIVGDRGQIGQCLRRKVGKRLCEERTFCETFTVALRQSAPTATIESAYRRPRALLDPGQPTECGIRTKRDHGAAHGDSK